MREFWRTASATALVAVVLAVGCREEPAEPSLNRDLGDETRTLMPTRMTLANPDVNKGSASWLDLRVPSFARHDAAPEGAGEASGGGADASEPEYAEDLRNLIADYNALLADGDYSELPGFFASSQADEVERLTGALPEVTMKLQELNEALPEPDPALQAAVDAMAVGKLLKVEAGTIRAESDGVASADIVNLPGARIRFVLEDGEWYIEHPIVAAAGDALSQLNVAALDEAIAGVKSGELTGDALTARIDAFKAAATALTTAGSKAPAEEAAPESGSDDSVGT